MSKIDTMQLTSLPFNPTPMLPAFQSLAGETTTFHAFPTAQGAPVYVAGNGSTANPVAVFDNTKRRITSILAMFAATAANNVYMAVDITGFVLIPGTTIYLPCRFFNGIAQAGNISLATSTGEASSFLCDNFSTKTFASPYVNYIEPADDIGGALLICDIRGFDYVAIRLAQGGTTAATKGQIYLGVN